MLVHLKQRQVTKLTMLVLAALTVLYTGFALNSKKVDAAGPPYEILYSNTTDHSSPQPLESATITNDMYVFVDDANLFASSTWWWEGSELKMIDATRHSTYKSYDLKDGSRYYFSDLGWAGENFIKAKPIAGTNEPQTVSIYNVPYGQKYHGATLSFKSTSIVGRGNVYVAAGNKGSGSSMDWSLEKISARTVGGSSEWSRTFSIGAAADELYDLTITDGSNPDLFAVGSYQDVTDIKPVVRVRDWTLGSGVWTKKDLWGAGVTGVVTSVVASITNATGASDKRVWVVGYEGGGATDPYWAMKKLNADNGNLITGGAWDQPVKNELGNTIKGEALEIAKDSNYIYIGGYVEDASGDPYWRLEKRNRTDGELVDEIELPGVKGKIEALAVQITQGTDAVWAGGYEDRGVGPEWRFQKFTFDGGGLFVQGVSKTWNSGSITEINLFGLDHVYVGGNQVVSGADLKWLVEAYDRDGVQKAGAEGILLEDDLSVGADNLSAMNLPYVVGWNGDTNAGFVRGVKPRADEVVCTDVLPALTLEDRYIIDHKYRGHLGASNGDDMSLPIEKANGIDIPIPQSPIIPPGKYDIIQVAADKDHSGEVDDVQLHEEFVTYFFGTNQANFAKTTQTDDIPNDWLYNSSVHSGLEIPFYISSTTIAHYIYDQSPGTWDNKGTLSYSGVLPNHGGSVDPICTVLDRYPQCSDGIDNDYDGVVDMADGGCTDANDDSEDDTPIVATTCTLVQGTNMAAGEYQIVVPLSGWLGSDAGPPVTGSFTLDRNGNTLNIAPGQYIATLESSDGYVGRASDTQGYESWEAVLSNSNGAVDTSAASDDLTDGLDSIQNVTYTNSESATNAAPLNLTSAVTEIFAQHAYQGQAGLNDVKPVCIGLNPVPMCTLVQGTGADEYDIVVDFSPTSYTDNTSAANTLVGPANTSHANNPFPINLPSGSYDITLQGYDSAPGRGVDTNEFWRVDLKKSDGTIKSSFTTPDLADNVDYVMQTYTAPTPVYFGSNFNQVYAEHGTVPSGNVGSVNALCAGFKKVDAIVNACTLTGDYVVYITGNDVGPTGEGYILSNQNNKNATSSLFSGNIPLGGITPGDYVVTLQSYDKHEPADATQPNETWKVQMFASDGTTKLGDDTGVSDDLPDDTSVNQTVVNNLFTIPAGVTQLRAYHGAYYDNSVSNSVYPVCVSLTSTIRPNLIPNVGPVAPSATYDSATGIYDNLTVTYLIRNIGGYAAGPFENHVELTFNGGSDTRTVAVAAGLAANTDTVSQSVTLGSSNVRPGDYTLYFKTDNADTVSEGIETDNEVTINGSSSLPPGPGVDVSIPAPDPGIVLTTTPGFVRNGKTADLTWDTKATYDMSCTLSGQGSNNLVSFNPSNIDDGPTGTFTTNVIKSKSVYTLNCTENLSGTAEVFSASTTIEVVPASEEL